MAKICKGFGMRVIAYDLFPNKSLDYLEYVSLDELLATSDLISLHCPLTEETKHIINEETIAKIRWCNSCKHFPRRPDQDRGPDLRNP